MIVRIIDGDILVYRCGFAAQKTTYSVQTEEGMHEFASHKEAVDFAASLKHQCFVDKHTTAEPVENALHNLNTILKKLINEDKYELYLTGKDNFRKNVATIQGYKANRKDAPKPIHYEALRKHMAYKWGAVVIDGQEADDEIGIRAYELLANGDEPLIISIDKDLDMIEGMHYNWTTDMYYTVGNLEAWRNYYKQTITGDRVDNIPGLPKVGDSKAYRLLDGCTSAAEMKLKAAEAWRKAYPDGVRTEKGDVITADKAFQEVCQLLWIRRKRT